MAEELSVDRVYHITNVGDGHFVTLKSSEEGAPVETVANTADFDKSTQWKAVRATQPGSWYLQNVGTSTYAVGTSAHPEKGVTGQHIPEPIRIILHANHSYTLETPEGRLRWYADPNLIVAAVKLQGAHVAPDPSSQWRIKAL